MWAARYCEFGGGASPRPIFWEEKVIEEALVLPPNFAVDVTYKLA